MWKKKKKKEKKKRKDDTKRKTCKKKSNSLFASGILSLSLLSTTNTIPSTSSKKCLHKARILSSPPTSQHTTPYPPFPFFFSPDSTLNPIVGIMTSTFPKSLYKMVVFPAASRPIKSSLGRGAGEEKEEPMVEKDKEKDKRTTDRPISAIPEFRRFVCTYFLKSFVCTPFFVNLIWRKRKRERSSFFLVVFSSC